MLRPKKDTKEKVKLSKESIRKARGIFSFMRPYRLAFAIGWFFLILSTSVGLIFPFMMGQLLGAGSGQVSSLNDSVKLINLQNINDVAIALFLLFAAQAVFSYFRVVIFTNVTENVLRDIRNVAFKKLIYMPMDFFNQNKVGELTSRMSSDISQIQETLKTTIAEFFRQIVIVVGGIAFIFVFSWKLALIMLATVPVMAIIAVIFGRFIRRLSKNSQDHAAESNSIIEEALTGIANVKSFTNEAFILGRFGKSVEEIRALNVKSGLWRGLFVSFIIFCLFGAIVFIIWRGLLMTQGPNPELAPSDFFSFIMYTIMMGASIGSLPDMYASIQKSIGATENLMNIIGNQDEKDLFKGSSKPALSGDIRFENVHFSYPQRSDVSVLRGISFHASRNETIALVGSSGSGKTTISSLLLHLYPINSGTILLDGVRIEELETEHLRKHMAIVPQEVILFAGSIRDNILFGNPEAKEEDIIRAAKQANAWEFIQSFPEGLNTQVGDRGIQLSGGQKQRIAIARAIIKDPTILILDEATSALDSESEKLVQDALDKLMVGRTSIVIAHRLSTIKHASKILVIQNGAVAEEGTHDDLIHKKGLYFNLVELQGIDLEH
ncbi:MAG: ATP-binding cassette domain-containing protein [Cryomorphaceae bacterium]|jgi:ABC-type multidrug transport system fused ATPase/permease subunit|nr:ATP-binding cassette domain-containing protein [Cryomorphaceae bacterium]